jgi:hypothetical protein
MRLFFHTPYNFVNDRNLIRRVQKMRQETTIDRTTLIQAFPEDLVLRLEIEDWLRQRKAVYTFDLRSITIEDDDLAMEFKMRWL